MAKKDLLLEARAFLFQRQKAYQHLFSEENQLGKQVLEDLAQFCRAEKSCFHADPRIHAVLEGRREVYLRLMDHLKLDSETLWKKYGRKDLG
jgi:hypothetical protein